MKALAGCYNEKKRRRAYGDGDFTVVGAGFAEGGLDGGLVLHFRRDHLFAFEELVAGHLAVDFCAEDKFAVAAVAELVHLFLDHQTGALRLALVVGAVDEGRAKAAALAPRFACEFDAQIHRVAGGAAERLEDVAEFLGRPFDVGLADVSAALDLVSVDALEQGSRVQVRGGSVVLFITLGRCVKEKKHSINFLRVREVMFLLKRDRCFLL